MSLMSRVSFVVLLTTTTAGFSQDMPKSQPQIWQAKPDAAAFEAQENERLTTAQRCIDAILAVKGARTIENTLAPYDEAIRQLNASSNLAGLMQEVHPDAAFRDRATAMSTKTAGVATALSLNPGVYKALAALDLSKADAATQYYVKRQMLEFRLAGVDKDDAARERLKRLNEQLTEEQSNFDRNISDDVRSVEVASVTELDGLPQDYIDGHKPGADGKIRITTNYPDFFPALDFAKSDDLRQKLWAAFNNRAYPKNREVLLSMMKTRYEIATLLGYSSWADYNAADKMVGSGRNIAGFIDNLDATTRPIAEREFALLLKEKQKTEPKATQIGEYDSWRMLELVRRSDYDFDSATIRPYLAYDKVKQGVLDTAATLFHISFRRETDAVAWDPSVETWDVIDNGRAIGRFYLDLHPRAGKYGHANMVPILDGIRRRQLPEAALVCNFAQPTASDPGLMDYEDVITFFHEFGHLMHHILGGQQRWAGISGISMETDFVEAPSQMLEKWMRSPQVLASFARDYKTGQPIPEELVNRMNRASAFGRAGKVADQNLLSAVSYGMYKDPPQDTDPGKVTLSAFHRYSLFVPLANDEDAHMYTSFTHLSGYSSAYYTYMWDKIIAEDFFSQFDQKNLLAGEAPMRYRRTVLEPGGSMSANDLVKNFLGRPGNMKAFQAWLGEEFAVAGAQPGRGGR